MRTSSSKSWQSAWRTWLSIEGPFFCSCQPTYWVPSYSKVSLIRGIASRNRLPHRNVGSPVERVQGGSRILGEGDVVVRQQLTFPDNHTPVDDGPGRAPPVNA